MSLKSLPTHNNVLFMGLTYTINMENSTKIRIRIIRIAIQKVSNASAFCLVYWPSFPYP